MTGNFSLRKWNFNTPDLKIEDCSKDGIKHFADTTTKTLGIIFDSHLDQFEFIFNDFKITGPITKRKILGKTAGIFDPIGLLSSITIVPKLLIQNLWHQRLSRDEPVDLAVRQRWQTFQDSIDNCGKLKIKRQVVGTNFKSLELHGFADASEVAYGACLYTKTINEDNSVQGIVGLVATFKVYFVLFICQATKSVHLELSSDLSTQAFLAAFRRFISRRGKPTQIYSDNATNFVGANNELRKLVKLHSNTIVNSLAHEGTDIEWKFIPPRSPHFGGL